MRSFGAIGLLAILHACTGATGVSDANSDTADPRSYTDAHDTIDAHDARVSDANRLDARRDVAIADTGTDSFEIADGDALHLTVTLPVDSPGPWWLRIDAGPTVFDSQAFCPVEINAR